MSRPTRGLHLVRAPSLACTFDGSGSSDSDGTIASLLVGCGATETARREPAPHPDAHVSRAAVSFPGDPEPWPTTAGSRAPCSPTSWCPTNAPPSAPRFTSFVHVSSRARSTPPARPTPTAPSRRMRGTFGDGTPGPVRASLRRTRSRAGGHLRSEGDRHRQRPAARHGRSTHSLPGSSRRNVAAGLRRFTTRPAPISRCTFDGSGSGDSGRQDRRRTPGTSATRPPAGFGSDNPPTPLRRAGPYPVT